MPPPAPPSRSPVLGFAVIGGVVVVVAAAFAYAAGWLTPDRLTPARMVDALSTNGGDPLGHRRNHAKGICFTGSFAANGAGARLSTAPMLASGTYPVLGRFAIGVQGPATPDAMGRVRSMAIRISADGQEWRSGMNAMPFFPVQSPQDFYGLTVATAPDPATGKPDPQKAGPFIAAHPEVQPFLQWAETAPWTGSYGDETYNSIDAFVFVDAAGARHAVRWAMQTTLTPQTVPPAELAARGPDFLAQDLKQRLSQGPLTWHLIVTVAAADDPTGDATKAWPDTRAHVDAGTLTIQAAQDEPDGPCRDINYDPTILPTGITVSDDPILPARSAAYANSFDRREAEASHYPHTPAGAKP